MRKRVACILFQKKLSESALQTFAEACLRFSPELTLRATEGVFIEIGKCASLYSEKTFLARVQILVRKTLSLQSDSYRVGIDISATRALIRAQDHTLALDSFQSLLQALPLESFFSFLNPFLTLTPESTQPLYPMIERLHRLGIRTLGEFLTIPKAELPARFGALALHLLVQIENVIENTNAEASSEVWPLWKPRETIEEKIELSMQDYCQSLEPVLFFSKQLLDRVYLRLQGRALRCAALELTLELERFSTVTQPTRRFKFEFMVPQGSSRGTLPILHERLERELSKKPLESAVLSLRVCITETAPGYDRQSSLFHHRDEIEEAYHAVLAQLAESIGKQNVFRAVTQEERFAERSWKKRTSEKEIQAKLEHQVPLRPTRLLSKPQKIEIMYQQIRYRKKTYTITEWSGVEQLHAHWLESPEFKNESRRYYQVKIKEGPPLWIYESIRESTRESARDSGERQFFLHGWFE